ncbi:MAG: RIP metalloprotease RseP [Acidobacteriaceae bacterium]
MSNFFIAIIAVVFVLGLMVLIHEWGHYIVAKSLGVTVKVFSIGFGKRLFGFERGGTDYRISALPFGGYVKMAGDNPLEGNTSDPGEFNNHSRFHRFLIAIAGPAVNILFAILLLGVYYSFHFERPIPPVVGVLEQNSPAQKAGLEPGDKIKAIEGKQDPSWEDIIAAIALSPNQPVAMQVERGGDLEDIRFSPRIETPDQTGSMGFEPAMPMVVTALVADDPAEKAGIRLGDTLKSVNGQPVFSVGALLRSLQTSQGAPVNIALVREGRLLTLTVQPKKNEVNGKPLYQIGLASNPVEVVKLPVGEAFAQSWSENAQSAQLIFEMVKKMVERKVSMKAMAGPVGIAQMSGQIARQPGFDTKLRFLSLISINLGVMNLFPIPILDGGVILLLLIEGVMRREISLNLKERIYQASFVFLVLFAVIVVFNDIAKMR